MLIILKALAQAKGIYGRQSGIFPDIGRSGEGSRFKLTPGLVPSALTHHCGWNFAEGDQQSAKSPHLV